MLLRRRIRRWPLHIWMYLFTVRCTFRMSTRRLYVILFVFSFSVTVTGISYLLLRGVLWWPRSFCFLPPDGVNIYLRLFIVFYYFSSSRRLHRLSTTLTTRAYIRVVLLTVFIFILYILLYVSLLPFFRWLPVRLG